MKPKIDLRWRAQQHFDRANSLLENYDASNSRHICLELRMCIEYLVYNMLLLYYDELPKRARKSWKPKDAMTHILDIAPDVEQSHTVFMGLQAAPGVEPKTVSFVGHDRRFSAKWANEAWQALGNYLHAPSISQLENKFEEGSEKLHKRIIEIRDELSAVFASNMFNVRLDENIAFKCDCGHTIQRREDTLDRDIECISCGEIFVHELVDGEHRFKIKQCDFPCEKCKAVTKAKASSIAKGNLIVCCACDSEYKIVNALVAELVVK
jgi:hypothetical protein